MTLTITACSVSRKPGAIQLHVAAYFALKYAYETWNEKHPKDAAVWIMNAGWATEECGRIFEESGRAPEAEYISKKFKTYEDEASFAETFMTDEPLRCVCPANPYRLNERLTLQKGVFVCVGDVRQTFTDNFRAIQGHRQNLFKVVIPTAAAQDGLKALYEMNISEATLFPDLDGFARSLNTNLRVVPDPEDRHLIP